MARLIDHRSEKTHSLAIALIRSRVFQTPNHDLRQTSRREWKAWISPSSSGESDVKNRTRHSAAIEDREGTLERFLDGTSDSDLRRAISPNVWRERPGCGILCFEVVGRWLAPLVAVGFISFITSALFMGADAATAAWWCYDAAAAASLP